MENVPETPPTNTTEFQWSDRRVHWKTFSEHGGSLEMVYHPKAVVADTIGQVFAIATTHLPLWTWDSAFRSPTEANAEAIYNRMKDIPWKGDVQVNHGNSSIFNEVKRTFETDVEGRPNIFLRVLGLPISMGVAAVSKIGRIDYYNPLTKAAYVFHPDERLGMFYTGKAKRYDEAKYPGAMALAAGIIPFVDSYLTHQGAKNALVQYQTEKERRHAAKVYEPIFAASVINTAAGLVIPFVPGTMEVVRDAATGVSEVAYTQLGRLLDLGSVALGFGTGHVTSRLPKKESSFGVLFNPEPPDPTKSPVKV